MNTKQDKRNNLWTLWTYFKKRFRVCKQSIQCRHIDITIFSKILIESYRISKLWCRHNTAVTYRWFPAAQTCGRRAPAGRRRRHRWRHSRCLETAEMLVGCQLGACRPVESRHGCRRGCVTCWRDRRTIQRYCQVMTCHIIIIIVVIIIITYLCI